jgi:tRNA A37 methylthiotransferase MiaB
LKREDEVEVSIWADLLVGFPWETEEDFMETYKLVEDWFITKCHIFPFSDHKIGETVPASKFPNQVDEKIKKDRVWRLEAIWEEKRDEFLDRNIWKEFEVLVEFIKNDNWKIKWKGWTENYIEANDENFEIKFWEIKRNSIISGRLIF